MHTLLFSTIEVSKQAFHRTALSAAIVNLKPIASGRIADVLVIPSRVVPRLTDLSPIEVSSLFNSVQLVGRAVERAYKADGLTIACQDGRAAGQSVSHVHVHIIPRRFKGDPFANNDDIYPTIEAHEEQLGKHIIRVERRQVRTAEQGVQRDYAASLSEASSGDSGNANMGNAAAVVLNGLVQNPAEPASGRSPSQESEPTLVDNEGRKPRSLEEMESEAEWLKTFMKEVEDEASAALSAR